MNCNYRVYGYTTKKGYKLLEITTDENKARNYLDNTNYEKILVIRHNIDLDSDMPIMMSFPKNKVKRK